ncbi:uncharacterized protein CTHT_0043660 [Thermochaetoides thermophila DSM 1495]|uniref:Prion-inhibition and propagation HeLo domain-containing protein n=1 Tax=Chaetomium thermophilum (strain DSM 1495 / CBS 144.50 / IMI 039719) TaxID=759272 RepID=G0S8W4_CHATD|nr:hypothetical protein CTHT_0043660 [Thermochaetoides thermophila DSM 1495]EGS19875.1 hypothetical protein CTHT_0043660 [Thermochaetoides thermophila DSM 1495]
MPKELESKRVELIIEYHRILAFGKAAGLVDVPEGSNLALTLGTETIELVAILARIQSIMTEFRDLNARYSDEDSSKPSVSMRNGNHGEGSGNTNLPIRPTFKRTPSLAAQYEEKKQQRKHLRGTNHLREFFQKTGHNLKEIVTHPGRIRWIVSDKDAFDALLKDLHTLTERLHELMRGHRERHIDEITAMTYRELIMTRNSVDDIKVSIEAVSNRINNFPFEGPSRPRHGATDFALRDLFQLKRMGRIAENVILELKNDGKIDLDERLKESGLKLQKLTAQEVFDNFSWNEPEMVYPAGLDRPRGVLTVGNDELPVWVEWKPIGDLRPNSPQDKEVFVRTGLLSEMLKMQKPSTMHVPECLGFFDDREVNECDRYGWIYKMPEGSSMDTRVVSLYHILGNDKHKPSLSKRVAMATALCTTVMNLHAVNWLHKGIYSDNVVFHFDKNGNYNAEKPLLSGFEYSRPDVGNTTNREVDAVWDLYRWPAIQREKPTDRNSRKTYDMYSLGLVMLEIAHWERLQNLMWLHDAPRDSDQSDDTSKKGKKFIANIGMGKEKLLPNVTLDESKGVRDWLLDIREGAPFRAAGRPNPLQALRHVAGDLYFHAVLRCIWAHGPNGFSVEELDDQSNDSDIGVQLQEAFMRYVVEPLRSVQI